MGSQTALEKMPRVREREALLNPVKWDCFNCGELKRDEATEEFYGDQSQVVCNTCYEVVQKIDVEIPKPKPEPRPEKFCFFIKAKDGDIQKPLVKYTRLEEFCLALRIGYFKEAIRLLRGKQSRYIWEGLEDNPMPF